MGRLSEALDYINSEEVSSEDIKYRYTYLLITDELRKYRTKYQREIREKKRLLLLELERL